MKFAQEFKKALQRDGYPQTWIDSAIPYGQLKKCLKQVTKELQDLGLSKETLAELAAPHTATSSSSIPTDLGFAYQLDGSSNHLRPRLTVFVQLKNGQAVDARLSPATRTFLQNIAARESIHQSPVVQPAVIDPSCATTVPVSSEQRGEGSCRDTSDSEVQQVEVPLVFDEKFFNILQTDVSNLDILQKREEEHLKKEIQSLGQEIAKVTKPKGRKGKDDLVKWRQIFELYLESAVFFSTREMDHGERSSTQALVQLQLFQDKVLERKLTQGLRSREAFTKFLNINTLLLSHLKFQELNKLAVSKILKKFDKRTSLGASKTFVTAVHSDHLLAGSIAKDLCAEVSQEIISVVPDIQDYLCPICFSVAYWPIRLDCNHVFCSRCMVKMQRKVERFCPLCRADCIMRAGLENFDTKHADFLKLYFPKEVKEKVRANELERGKEVFGPDYTDRPCCVM